MEFTFSLEFNFSIQQLFPRHFIFSETMQLIMFYVILLIEIAIKSKRKTEVTIMEFKSIFNKGHNCRRKKTDRKKNL